VLNRLIKVRSWKILRTSTPEKLPTHVSLPNWLRRAVAGSYIQPPARSSMHIFLRAGSHLLGFTGGKLSFAAHID
jgi:hypothetical protein